MTPITPFNVKLLQLTEVSVRSMAQITKLDTFDGATKNFHPEGLFSNEIFGQNGEISRMRKFAFIDIKVPILHPLIYRILGKLKRIYPEIMAKRAYARWDPDLKDFVKSDAVDGKTGYTFFMEHYHEIEFPERLSDQRALSIKLINRVRDVAVNTRVIVAPAGYRDYVIYDDREEEDEVNKLYRRLLAQANAITPDIYQTTPQEYDRTRFSMQMAFNAIYEYYESIIRGKNKLILGHVMTRQVRDGTRNVLTTQNLDVKELFGAGTPTTNSTGIGLFQFIKAYRPKCLYRVQNGFLTSVFRSPGAPAKLVRRDTLMGEEVILDVEDYDQWMTSEGIEKLFNLYSETERRHEPIIVGNHYLGLIYNDGSRVKLFNGMQDLPEGFSPSQVKPVTFAEFLYSQVYMVEDEVTLNVTRFPVTGFGSIYPSLPYLKVTTETVKLKPLNDYWEEDKDAPILREFPIRSEAFIDTMMPAPDKLAGLTADFDGDKGTGNGVYTVEGVEESKAVMASREFHIKTDGNIAHSLATDTVNFLLADMTGEPKVTPEDVARFNALYGLTPEEPAPATEDLKEDLTGIPRKKREAAQETTPEDITFVFGDVKYSMLKILEMVKANPEMREIPITKLDWVLGHETKDPVSMQAADSEQPLIVTPFKMGTYVTIDGLYRLAKGVDQGKQNMFAYVLSTSQFEAARIQ